MHYLNTLKNLVVKIRFRSENALLNSEKWATNLLIFDHFSLIKSEFLLPKRFLPLNFLAW